jgi:hypothetical protein
LPPINELYITYFLLAKLYTNNMGRLPIWARSGNQYIIIAFRSRCNAILCAPYVNRSNKHQLAAYNSIMRSLANRGHDVDLQILNNEVSTKFKATIVDKWKVWYQLVPPDVYIVAMLLSEPFKPSNPTSSPSSPVYHPPSPVTFGNCSFHKQS